MTNKGTPGAYRQLKHQHVDYIKAVEALGLAVRHAGPLKEPVTQLVQLGAAAAIRSDRSRPASPARPHRLASFPVIFCVP